MSQCPHWGAGIFPSVEYRNPDHPRDAVELRAKLGPLLVILASRSTTPESVMAEVWPSTLVRYMLPTVSPPASPSLHNRLRAHGSYLGQ